MRRSRLTESPILKGIKAVETAGQSTERLCCVEDGQKFMIFGLRSTRECHLFTFCAESAH